MVILLITDVNLGNASSDTITMTGLDSDIVPSGYDKRFGYLVINGETYSLMELLIYELDVDEGCNIEGGAVINTLKLKILQIIVL